MSTSAIVKNMNDGEMICSDATTVSTTIKFDMGDLAISGLDKKLNAVSAYESRGRLRSLRHAARVYPTITFTAMMAELTSTLSDDIPISDVLLRPSGSAWASAVSTRASTGDVFTCDVLFRWIGTTLGDSAEHEILCEDVHFLADFAEGDPNKWTVNGTIYGTITVDGIVSLAEPS